MPRPAAPPVRVACLGDSITFGAGLPDREAASYPAVLQGLLGPKYQVRNFGVGGATLLGKGDRPYRRTPEYRSAVGSDPHVVVLALGTNDGKPHNHRHAADLPADLGAVADPFRPLPGRPVVYVCLPPPVFAELGGISEARVRTLRPSLRAAARDAKLEVIDLFAGLAGRAELFPDGVHPNPAGARAIAELVAAAVRT